MKDRNLFHQCDDGSSRHIWNVSNPLTDYTVVQPRRNDFGLWLIHGYTSIMQWKMLLRDKCTVQAPNSGPTANLERCAVSELQQVIYKLPRAKPIWIVSIVFVLVIPSISHARALCNNTMVQQLRREIEFTRVSSFLRNKRFQKHFSMSCFRCSEQHAWNGIFLWSTAFSEFFLCCFRNISFVSKPINYKWLIIQLLERKFRCTAREYLCT